MKYVIKMEDTKTYWNKKEGWKDTPFSGTQFGKLNIFRFIYKDDLEKKYGKKLVFSKITSLKTHTAFQKFLMRLI